MSVSRSVLEAFGVPDAIPEMLSGGRTNRTMRVRAGHDLVLQHLRSGGPYDLLATMENLVRVTSHLEWKHRFEAAAEGDEVGATWWPELVATVDAKPYVMTADGDVWRAYAYRDGRIARSIQAPATLANVAAMFGRFSGATLDLGGPDLAVSAPGFHDLDRVRAEFETALVAAAGDTQGAERVALLEPTLSEVRSLADQIAERADADGLASVRRRVVHNDTKISNVLLHPSKPRAIAVLDLDLVMMGGLWQDFGDLIRSAAWYVADRGPVVSPELFKEMAGAFVDGAENTVSDAELATFAIAGPRLSTELALRYLSDHLRTDPVLRVAGDHGHLRRGLANAKLATEMLSAYDALRFVVDDLIARR